MKRADAWNRFADAGRALLVGGAATAPLIRRDWRASINAIALIFAVSTATKVIKTSWEEPHPDGEDRQSFPSEHAVDGFAAAAIVGREFNGGIGLAAIGLATAISLARLFSGKHYVADVIAGAGMGFAIARLAQPRSSIR